MNYKKHLQEKLQDTVKKLYSLSIGIGLEYPTLKKHGDYATNIPLLLAKELKKSPIEVAEEIKKSLVSLNYLGNVDVVHPGFINFFLKDDVVAKTILNDVFKDRLFPIINSRNKVIVEHTSVNPNKAMHVGHIRNAVLGDSISRLLKKVGYDVEVHNYIDDTGVQVADTINGLNNLDLPPQKDRKFDDYCWDVYTEINKAYESSPELLEKRVSIVHSLEQRNSVIAKKSAKIVDKILGCHLDLLSTFDIYYDLLVYESDIIGFGFWEVAFEKLKKSKNFYFETKGVNKGCWVLKYNNDRFKDKVFVRSNGTKVYTAKDTAYHMWKYSLLEKDFLYKAWGKLFKGHTTYRTHKNGKKKTQFGKGKKIINVIDSRQTYPQEMVKYALYSLGYEKEADNYNHIAYGVVSLSSETANALGVDTSNGKETYAMSGRKGIGVNITDLLTLLENEVKKLQKKQENGTEKVVSAKDIAIGAIKHYMLKNNPNSQVIFDYKQALKLVGNTGPYLQYSHARASNILAKSKNFAKTYVKQDKLTNSESNLIKRFSELSNIIDCTLSDYNIAILLEFAFNLSKDFHAFYEKNNVLKSRGNVKNFRLTVVKAYTLVIKDVLNILGIVAPKKM